ncbi:MAG: dioxygenase [Pseudomonas formosensis]|nr:dioxygenase [Halopseudomonas formosensis]
MTLRMDHFTIVTDQLEATRQFYVDLLGFEVGPRPPFPVDGLWLYADSYPMLHVISVEQMPEPRRGVLDHMAFFSSGLGSMLDKLDGHNVRYRIIRAPGENRTWQGFFKDPNDVEVELDFAAEETPPADWKQRSKR